MKTDDGAARQTLRADGGTEAQSADISAQVEAERVAGLYAAAANPTLIGLLFCLLPVGFLWGILPAGLLLGWLGARAFMVTLRCIDILQYRRARHDPSTTVYWRRRFLLLLSLDGLSWGAMGGLLHHPALPGFDGALLATLVGVGAIGLLSLSTFFIAYLLFASLSFALFLVHAIGAATPAAAYSALGLLVFLGLSLFESRRAEARSIELMRLRYEHASAAEQRQLALQQAERLSSSKSRMVAVMSHEIRTPLNGILGMTQLLERSPLSPQQSEQLELVHRSGRHLLALVNDMLDLAQIESGKLTVQCAPVALRETIDEVCSLLRANAAGKGLDFELRISPSLPACVSGDAARIKQVLHNLVGNAIKFTDQGSVTVEVDSWAAPGVQTLLRFVVRDTGEGIAATELERVFAPFEQASHERLRQREGTGLGLTISRELACAMGGELHCDSEPGRGSVFTFSLPLLPCTPSQADGAPQALTSLPQLQGRVLLVEDSPVNMIVAASMLERCGLQVEQAQDGQQALDQLADGSFDLVLMDCQMPGLDGFETTRRWRAQEQRQHRQPLPIVALTANAGSGDRERCLASGMNDYLPKPFELDGLITVVQRHLLHAARR